MDCSKLAENGTPELGMEFNSEEDAYKFYNKYAFKMGFSVRKDYLNKDKDGVTTSRRYSCCKEERTMKYRVHDLVLEHNHELHIAQCAHMMPSQRKVSVAQGFQAEISEDAGLSLKQSHELMGKEAGGMGNVGYTREDLKRYLRTRRERSLKYGEAGMLIDYNFFGDVVTFDTTYKTNKEYRPLGVFVGFNQHRQIVIFGAALMYDETIDSFKWVFGTFLEAMCGKHPSTILTDQDHAMAAALSLSCLKHFTVYFFRHFNSVVDEKRHNELIAEYEMRQKLPMVGLRQTPMLVHASETYSPTVFVAFQNEYGESTTMVY
nr:protein FAR1-RELATED SEQUENCE 5-like [Coffea arabica]